MLQAPLAIEEGYRVSTRQRFHSERAAYYKRPASNPKTPNTREMYLRLALLWQISSGVRFFGIPKRGFACFMGGRLMEGRSMDGDWRADRDRWLAPFVGALRHKTRARMCPAYIAGLIGPGDRKSVQPMAARAGEVGYDQLHHFVAAGVWDSAPLEAALLKEADGLVGDEAGFLVIDDTALPKKGRHSVGVAPQYASSLGKTANCQSLVSVTLASREVPVMVGLQLFLPESWTDDPERMARARVPKDRQTALTKPEIAIEEVDRVIASGARFGCVLADSGYGSSGPFRQALSERGLLWAVGLSRRQNVYPADVALIFPVAKAGKPRKYHIPDQSPVSAEALLAGGKWQKVSWRRGTKGRLTCLFPARRVRVADGHKHRILSNRMQCMPGDEVSQNR